MRITPPLFGMISGICTSVGLLPHLIVLSALLMARQNPPVASLIVFTIAAKILGEWLFWRISAQRMDQEKRLHNWRTMANKELISHPNVSIALLMMAVDVLSEGALFFIALKTSIPPALILVVFLGCQALSAPIQGISSDYFSQKKSLIFAALIGMLAISAAGAVPSDGNPQISTSLINLLGLSSLTPKALMILILCIKGTLGNTSVIARAAIANAIKFKTINKIKA